jgi:hypothetical protein
MTNGMLTLALHATCQVMQEFGRETWLTHPAMLLSCLFNEPSSDRTWPFHICWWPSSLFLWMDLKFW